MLDFSNDVPISVRSVATMVPSREPRNVADQSPVKMRTKSRCVTPGILNCGSSFCLFASTLSYGPWLRVDVVLVLTYPPLVLDWREAMRGVRSVAMVAVEMLLSSNGRGCPT